MSDSIDLRPLFADYASGEISAKQLETLEAALREDADLRRDFIEYMNVDSALAYAGQRYDSAELAVGEYRLDRGLLDLRFRGGVTVYIEAPAQFDAVSDNRLLLRSGRLSASVAPEGVGFTVDTPDAEVIDFGTEFSVDVESGASEVHVFEGLVRVQPRSRKDGKAGQAVNLHGW